MSNIKTILDVIFVKDINIGGVGSGTGGKLLSSSVSSAAGSLLVGDDNSYSSFTPTSATVKGALSGIDSALTAKLNTSFSNASGILGLTNGGTGQTTAFAAAAALSPLTTKGDLWGYSTFNTRIPVGTNGQVLTADSTNGLGVSWQSSPGTVSSVSATVPPYMSITGSPITSSGTLAFNFISESPNLFFASPDGTSGPPGFRSIVAADIPVLNQNTTGSAGSLSGILALANGGTGVSAITPNDAFNALSPMTAPGDLIAGGLGGIATALPVGTAGQVLTVVGGTPVWQTPAPTGVTNFVFTNGGGFTGTVTTSTSTPTLSLVGTLSGDVTGPLTATVLSAITNATLTTLSALSLPFSQLSGQATLAQLPSIANDTVLGNVSGITAVPTALTQTQLTTLINVFSSSLSGAVPASGGGTVNFLRADGTWAAPAGSVTSVATGTGLTGGPITSTGTISIANTAVTPGAYTNANITVDQQGRITLAASGSAGFVNPMTTAGDLLFENATPAPDRLPIGTTGQVLTVVAGLPAWAPSAAGGTWKKDLFVLTGTDITNQYIDLSFPALTDSISFLVKGGSIQIEGASYDYTVSYTGGVAGVTRITFVNDLATGGISALVATDVLVIQYQH